MNKSPASALPAHRSLRATAPAGSGESLRESVEAVIVAIILTLSFRTFLGENYQIPTGSMAPTLQGRHMDIECPDCGYQYRTGASVENEEDGRAAGEIRETTCPICRYSLVLDKKADLNQRSFAGDRIIVNKLAYLYYEPERWDVFVFKYPGNPKINYIKRLVGLPGETLRVRHGDVWTAPTGTGGPVGDFEIARKPPDKVEAMLQLVDDTYYLPQSLQNSGWPFRWGAVNPAGDAWQLQQDGTLIVEPTEQEAWVGYRHLIPRDEDRKAIERGARVDITGYYGQLITDYYEYNDGYPRPMYYADGWTTDGWNWVGDLAMEVDLEVLSSNGELSFDIVEGGLHHYCRIDIATGGVKLTLGDQQFEDAERKTSNEVTGETPIRGPGKHVLKFANVDDQLFLWVDGKSIEFSSPATFRSPPDMRPQWSERDPGDIVPLRMGVKQASVRASRLRVFRDVYYNAARFDDRVADCDYGPMWVENLDEVFRVLTDPTSWESTEMFASRREVTFALGPDQFFPMGDNSPQSKDARLWSVATMNGLEPPPFVRRELLIGKAVFIYWPHSWNFTRIPFMIPNYQRIGSIR